MFKTIVVGCDARPASQDALALALMLAELADTRLIAAYIQEPEVRWASHHDHHYEQRTRQEADGVRARVRRALGRDPRREFLAVPARTPAAGLEEVARAKQADLIVLGSTHLGTVGRVLVGSTAERLLVSSASAISVAPRGFAEREHRQMASVGVTVDVRAGFSLALATACALAERNGGELVSFSIEDAALGGDRFRPSTEHLDLIVVGTRPRRHGRNTSRRLIHGSTAPLMVVPEGAAGCDALVVAQPWRHDVGDR